MAGTTSRLSIPYPTGTDPVNVATDMQTMATRLDNIATPKYVTALPGSPADGDEIFYQADATAGVIWHLRYRSGSASTYKWEYVGGPPLSAEVQTKETSASTSYTDLATVGPSLTIPLAGDYEFLLVANASNNTAGAFSYASLKFSTSEAVDNDAAIIMSAIVNAEAHLTQVNMRTVPSAATVAKLRYRVGSGTGAWQRRRLIARPVRVG